MSVAPAYSASKAFVSNYLQGVRYRFEKLKLPIVVTDVQPGFVDTRMAKGDRLFWVASPQTAARQIVAAIRGRKQHVYVTRRWRLIAWVLRIVPDALYSKTLNRCAMITGRWGKPSEVLLDLVVDDDGSVRGVANPGRQNAPIRRGHFDATRAR